MAKAQVKAKALRFDDAILNVEAEVKATRRGHVMLASSVALAFIVGNIIPAADAPEYKPAKTIKEALKARFEHEGQKADRTIRAYLDVGERLFKWVSAHPENAEVKRMLPGVTSAASVADATKTVARFFDDRGVISYADMMKAVGYQAPARTETTPEERAAKAIETAAKKIEDGDTSAKKIATAIAETIPDPVAAVVALVHRLSKPEELDKVTKALLAMRKKFMDTAEKAKAAAAKKTGKGGKVQATGKRHTGETANA